MEKRCLELRAKRFRSRISSTTHLPPSPARPHIENEPQYSGSTVTRVILLPHSRWRGDGQTGDKGLDLPARSPALRGEGRAEPFLRDNSCVYLRETH